METLMFAHSKVIVILLSKSVSVLMHIHSKDLVSGKARVRHAEKIEKKLENTADEVSTSDINICTLLGDDIGRVGIVLKFQGQSLFKMPNKPVDEWLLPERSISLYQLLDGHRLSSKGKVVLAYILAKSVWQYYDSDWMSSHWTAELIHFMKEESFGRTNKSGQSSFNIFAPYFALQAPPSDKSSVLEYINDTSFIHHYPRVVALGILLVEICRGENKRYLGSTLENFTRRMNNEYTWYRGIAMYDEEWPYLELKNERCKEMYRNVVKTCFNQEIFSDSPLIEQRRAKIFKEIVHPLQTLLQDLKWIDDSGNIKRSTSGDVHAEMPVVGGPSPKFLEKVADEVLYALISLINDSANHLGRPESREWLERIQSLPLSNNLVTWFSSKSIRKTVPRIKIAVLDTGYDETAAFIADDEVRRKRIAGWKDFSGTETKAVDQDGHGTQVLSLVMKVAPAADIYVARIAKDRPTLKEEGHKISANTAKVMAP